MRPVRKRKDALAGDGGWANKVEKKCAAEATKIGSACGAGTPKSTMTMAAVVARTGTTVCMTMHNWQWSASDLIDEGA